MRRACLASLVTTSLLTLACQDGGAKPRPGAGDTGIELDTGSADEASTEQPGDDAPGGHGGSGSDDGEPMSNEPKWDTLAIPDGGNNCDVDETHSYIWIANSSQGTVSKINTQTLIEEGRYLTRETPGNPSRTSVSLSGDVAVANRRGGVVKFYSSAASCPDTNGTPGVQTSTGRDDVLPFGTDECMAWYTHFDYSTQRPVAWVQGELDPATCTYEDEKLWTAGGRGNAEVVLLDGGTGTIEHIVVIPNVIGWAGLYGGAVDGDGNFWTIDHSWDGPSTLIYVDRESFVHETWPVEGEVHYGIAVDSRGRPWLCGSGGVSRFDPDAETWTHLPPQNDRSPIGGCMEDGQGTLWTSSYPHATLIGIDTETVQIVASIPIPSYVHGVSVDFQGHVWGVGLGSSKAYRVDPNSKTVDTVSGLVGAYTYSDMTGFALSAAGSPSG